jgi:hypothetical protein
METQTHAHDTDPVGLALLPHQRCARGPRRPAPTRGGDTLAGRSWREGDGRHTLCPPSPATHGTSDVAINLISYQIAFSRSKCPRGAQRA